MPKKNATNKSDVKITPNDFAVHFSTATENLINSSNFPNSPLILTSLTKSKFYFSPI